MVKGHSGVAVGEAYLLINLIGEFRVGDDHEILNVGGVEPDFQCIFWHNGYQHVLLYRFFFSVHFDDAFPLHDVNAEFLVYFCRNGIVKLFERVHAIECVEQEYVVFDTSRGNDVLS